MAGIRTLRPIDKLLLDSSEMTAKDLAEKYKDISREELIKEYLLLRKQYNQRGVLLTRIRKMTNGYD